MKEFVEKLIGRLEEKFKYNSEQAEIWRNGSDKDAFFREKKDLYMDRANTYGEVMRIVNQLEEEYNSGWISCSERLPSKEGEYLTFVEYDDDEFIAIDEFLCEGILKEWNCTPNNRVIAWMELPEKYKEKKNGSS